MPEKGKPKAYTAGGVEVPNARFILKGIARTGVHSIVLDGEFFASNWNDTNSAVKTQTFDASLAKKLKFNAFDYLPYKDWKKHSCPLPLSTRKLLLRRLVNKLNMPTIQIVKPIKYGVVLTPQLVVRYMEYLAKKGYEGVVAKTLDGLYEFKKSKVWIKLKPNYTADLKIVGATIGTGRNSKRLGRLIVTGTIDGRKIKTRCGGGFTDKLRDDLWAMHKKGRLVGRIAECVFDSMTVEDALRFPRFKRLREPCDKNSSKN